MLMNASPVEELASNHPTKSLTDVHVWHFRLNFLDVTREVASL